MATFQASSKNSAEVTVVHGSSSYLKCDQCLSARIGTKARLGSYSCMSSKAGHYRVCAEESRLNAVKVEDNGRRIHWVEAEARWGALGRQDTTSDSARGAKAQHSTPTTNSGGSCPVEELLGDSPFSVESSGLPGGATLA